MFLPAQTTTTPRHLTLTHPFRIFYFGLSIYVLAKLYLLAVTYLPAGMARLGDDGLIYLWKGKLALMGDGSQYPALRDILALETAAPALEKTRTAVSQLYSGTVRPLADLFYGTVLQLGLNLKGSALLSELIGLAMMTAGTAALLLRLFGPLAAGIGLVFLAFAHFPNQGIYSYIPSTMALALGMLLWARLYRNSPGPVAGFVAALVVASVHPAGKLYALLGVLFHVLGRQPLRLTPDKPAFILYASLIAGVLASSLWPLLWPPFALPRQVLTGGLNLSPDFLAANGKHALSLLIDPVIRKNWVLAFLALLGIGVYFRETLNRSTALLTLAFTGLCLASLAHELPTYPAELFSRLLVPTLILSAGVAGGATIAILGRQGRWPRLARWIFGTGFSFLVTLWCWDYAFGKLNERTQVIDESALSRHLASLPSGTTILYPELDITINSSFLLGGYRFGAFVYPTLAGNPLLAEQLDVRRPAVLLAREPATLNSLAASRTKTLTLRRLGFQLRETASLRIEVPAGKPFSHLEMLVDNPEQAFKLEISGDGQVRHVIVPAGKRGWLAIWDGSPVANLELVLPKRPAWIEGINAAPSNGLIWPWLQEATLTWQMRKGRTLAKRTFSQRFTASALLAANQAAELAPWLHPDRPYRAEGGGFVLLNTRYVPTPLP